MQLSSDQSNGVSILRLVGRFDARETAPVRQWFDTDSSNQIIVNLSEVNFLDSSALSVLVQEMKRRRERGGDLLLAGLLQPVRIIFELTRLDRAFRIAASEEDAFSMLSQ